MMLYIAVTDAIMSADQKHGSKIEGTGILQTLKAGLLNSMSRMIDQVDEGAFEFADAPVLQTHPLTEPIEGEERPAMSMIKQQHSVGSSPLESRRKDWAYQPPNW